MNPTLCIIGAGPSGLVTLKVMIENGFAPTVFDKHSQFGGVWRSIDGLTWRNMHTNVSKYFMTFSDFPWPESAPIFPSTEQVLDYIHSYVSHFDLEKYIKYNSNVTLVTQLENKKWLVKWIDVSTNETHENVFDYVVVSTGMFSNPNIPQFENSDQFNGQILHSMSYNKLKSNENLAGKSVIIVGHSYSAVEICSDLADMGVKVINIIKRPYWIVQKYIKINESGCLPCDFTFANRNRAYNINKPTNNNPEMNKNKNSYLATLCKAQNEIPELYIDPKSTEPPYVSFSNGYVDNVKNGKIEVVKQKIKSFTSDGVILADGSCKPADVVVLCTGFRLNLSYIDAKVLAKMEYDEDCTIRPLILYKGVIHPDIENIAFVGMIREQVIPSIELQARYVSLIFKKKKELPSRDELLVALNKERESRLANMKVQHPRSVTYPDDLARDIGVLPHFEQIRATDIDSYEALWEGPISAAHYEISDNKCDTRVNYLHEINRVRKQFLGSN